MAMISSKQSGFSSRRYFRIPALSNWKMAVVSPFWNRRYVGASSSGMSSISISIPLLFLILFKVWVMMSKVFKPRKSIFSSPASSTSEPSYCTTMVSEFLEVANGMQSNRLSRPMMTPQACTPVPRSVPSSFKANCKVCFTNGVPFSSSFFSSGVASMAFSRVLASSGTIFDRRSLSDSGSISARAQSLMAVLPFISISVTITATFSLPYFSLTYWMVFSRPLPSMSISISGSEIRSGFKKRSNSRSYLMGSMLVICRQ